MCSQMQGFFYFQTAKAVLASIVTTELICDNSRWRTCKVRAHGYSKQKTFDHWFAMDLTI